MLTTTQTNNTSSWVEFGLKCQVCFKFSHVSQCSAILRRIHIFIKARPGIIIGKKDRSVGIYFI